MKRIFLSLTLLLALVAGGVQAQDDRLQIAASYSILADVVMNVVGDAADVSSLMPVGADPHSFEPSPRDLTAIADADVVFVNGALFEESLLPAIENAGEETTIIEASACVEMIAFGAGGHDHEGEDHDHESEDHDHEGEMTMSEDMMVLAALCETHYAEMEAIHDHEHDDHGEDHDHNHGSVETLGALYTADCGEGHSHDHEGEDHSEHGDDEHQGEDHDHGACDPHVWMDPHNVMYWTMLIRDTLVEMDPANAEIYTANAAAYLEQLDALFHDTIEPMVETIPEENRIMVTNHESLGYFAGRFDFEVVTTVIPGGATAVEPSAADIAGVIDTINDEGVPAIFAETTVSDAVMEQIAAETDAQLFVLYSGSLSDTDGPASTYIDYMLYNTTTIVEALGGQMMTSSD